MTTRERKFFTAPKTQRKAPAGGVRGLESIQDRAIRSNNIVVQRKRLVKGGYSLAYSNASWKRDGPEKVNATRSLITGLGGFSCCLREKKESETSRQKKASKAVKEGGIGKQSLRQFKRECCGNKRNWRKGLPHEEKWEVNGKRGASIEESQERR